jgi:hypothetical protein
MSRVQALHEKWMKSREYRRAYGDLAPEFAFARSVIKASVRAGSTTRRWRAGP